MAEQITVPIVTADAVTNLAELKKAIKDAKAQLDEMNVGSLGYRAQLNELIKMQNLMRGAMNGTTASFEDLTEAAEGTTKTYNGLVNQMASMKRELRNIDVSTEEGAEAFKTLAGQIDAVNDELKRMDAMKGDFQRNVGNYESALKGWAGSADALDKGLKAATGGVNGLKGGMQALAANPAMATFGILVSVAMKLADALKDNKTATDAFKKGLDALKPLMDFFSGILETVAEWLAELIGKVSAFLGSSGILQKVIKAVMGVGNAILQYVIAPFKGIVAAIKVFQEEGIKGIGNAAKAFGAEIKNGVSFKQNFQNGQAVADTMLDGMASRKPKAKETGKALAKETADAWEKEMQKRVKEFAEKVKARTEAEKYLKGLRDATQADIDAATSAMDADLQAEFDATLAYMQNEADAEKAIQEQAEKDAEQAAQKKIAAMQGFASGTADLLDAIADAYESNGELSEKEEKRVKNLRIAAATISMLQGAVTAYASAQSLGVPMGPIVGAINAAAVVATGLANIAKIKATNVSRDSAPSTNAPATATPATVQAPALETAVPTTTVVNGASTETALNNAARPQKVYLVESEQQAMGTRVQTVQDEVTF